MQLFPSGLTNYHDNPLFGMAEFLFGSMISVFWSGQTLFFTQLVQNNFVPKFELLE
jgi:hypothetical protein